MLSDMQNFILLWIATKDVKDNFYNTSIKMTPHMLFCKITATCLGFYLLYKCFPFPPTICTWGKKTVYTAEVVLLTCLH